MCGIRRRGTRFISRDLRSSDGRLVRLSAIGWPGGGARLSTGKIWLYDRNHSRAYDRWVILYCKRAHELAAEQIRKEFHDLDSGLRLQLGAQVGALADDVWSGVLRHRDDRVFHRALRYRAFRVGGISSQPAPVGSDDSLRHGHAEDGAGGEAHLRSDARAEVGD